MARKSFNPQELLQSVLASDFDLTAFNQIDETQFAEAPNFLEFNIAKEFCNSTLLPWQIEAGMHLFSEYCPECSDKNYTTDLFDQPIEDIKKHVVFLQHGVCPSCNKNKLELFTIGEDHPSKPSLKSEFSACIGQRAGKCLAASTEVLTPTGAVAISKLKVGDIVYGYEPDGSIKETKVLNVFDQGEKEVWDLYRYDSLIVSCTPDHVFLSSYADKNNMRGKFYRHPHTEQRTEDILSKKGKVFRRAFQDIDGGTVDEPYAYAIGALLGDGCSMQGTSNRIDISSATETIPSKVSGILGTSLKKYSDSNYTWSMYRDEVKCNHYENWCKDRKAAEKIVDLGIIRTWNKKSQLEFLAGLIDTDGSVYLAKNKHGQHSSLVLSFSSLSKSLVDAVSWLILSHFQFNMNYNQDIREKYSTVNHVLRIKDNAKIKRVLRALDPYLVTPSKKWKPEYEKFKERNSNSSYVNLKCKGKRIERTFDIEVDNETSLFVLAAEGLITHNSKSIACFTAYQLHRWLKIPDPVAHYDLPKMEVILGTFSALSDEQAEENLWMPFRGLYDSAPWFQKYNEFLKSEQKRLNVPLIDVRDTYIFYPAKRMLLAFTGADDRKKRGRTRLFGAIDEIAFFNSDVGKKGGKVMDADKNYTALNNSLTTIRKKAMTRMVKYNDYNVLLPLMYNASSPLNVRDKIMRLVKEAHLNPWAYAVHRATWEANPDYTIDDCRNINRGLSETDFWRDFGAVPPFSDAPYISESRFLSKLCQPVPPIMVAKEDYFIDAMGDRYLTLKAQIPRADKMVPRLLSIDNGFNNNAFAACIFRWDNFSKKPVLEFGVNLYPDRDAKLFINFPAMFDNFILPIVQNFLIRHVFYDRWQSLDQIQRLRQMKIDAQSHSLAFEKDFLPLKQQLVSGNFVFPECVTDIERVKEAADPLRMVKTDPVAMLIWQALTVREVGRKVMKPLDGDDDLFRAFALGASRFADEKIQKTYIGYGGGVLQSQGGGVLGRTYSMGGGIASTGQGASLGSARTFGRRR